MFQISRFARTALLAALAALVAVVAASPAVAQGFYFKEIRKGDRIYVFNIAANAERFEKSGEMGAGITKLGAGPNGETVVGDNERALQDPPPPPPPPAPFKISGLIFGDYYYFATHHLPTWEDQQGFWLRRAYFTYDHTISPALTARLRLEMNGDGKLAGGSLTPYVKDAYLAWTYRGRQKMTLGIQPSLSFDYLESVWGLRHIEKTPLDLYRWDSSRDTGVSTPPSSATNPAVTARRTGSRATAPRPVMKPIQVSPSRAWSRSSSGTRTPIGPRPRSSSPIGPRRRAPGSSTPSRNDARRTRRRPPT